MEILMFITSTLVSILSILIAYMALRRNKEKDHLKEALDNGVLLSDIGYIKKSLDRIENRLQHVEINYNDLLRRIIILEEKVNEWYGYSFNNSYMLFIRRTV